MRRLAAGASPALNQTQTVVMKGRRYAVISGASTSQQGDQFATELSLPAVSAAQQGVYVCLAANDNGYVGREAFLRVATGAPRAETSSKPDLNGLAAARILSANMPE